jgi:hypothetical protein
MNMGAFKLKRFLKTIFIVNTINTYFLYDKYKNINSLVKFELLLITTRVMVAERFSNLKK